MGQECVVDCALLLGSDFAASAPRCMVRGHHFCTKAYSTGSPCCEVLLSLVLLLCCPASAGWRCSGGVGG